MGRMLNAWRRAIVVAHRAECRLFHPDVVFLGDSITREWLEAKPGFFLLRRRANAGIDGQTSADMRARFEPDVVARRPRVVHIMAGTNDLWHGRPGPAAADALANVAAMIARAQEAGIVPVVAAPPPVMPKALPLFSQPELFPALREGVAAACVSAGVAHVDYDEVLGDGAGGIRPDFTTDGVHLSAAGYHAMRPVAERALAAALRAER